jgi:hypothetical protein
MIDKLKDLYKHFKPRERILFYSAAAFFVFMLCDFLVLAPILSHLKVLDTEIKTKSQAIQRDMRILSFSRNTGPIKTTSTRERNHRKKSSPGF